MTTAFPRLVVVDDTDPSIQYSPSGIFQLDTSGEWDNLAIGGPVYNHTVHQSAGVNGTVSFKFNGTFARVNIGMSAFGQTWDCQIDGRTIDAQNANGDVITNFMACDTGDTLAGSTGEHTLTVELGFGSFADTNATIWLDSFEYAPLASDPLDAVVLKIDSSDPALTYYNSTGGWSFQGVGTNSTQSDSSMGFTFNGTSVSLYTVVFGSSTSYYEQNSAFYSVDGKGSQDFVLPGSRKIDSNGNYTNIFNVPLFNASGLSAGQHQINVGIPLNPARDSQWLAIDYFLVTTNPHSSSSPTHTPTPSKSSNNLGAIIGGAVGGGIVLIALLLGVFFLCRRRKSKKNQFGHGISGPLDITGFDAKAMCPGASPMFHPQPSPSFQSSSFQPYNMPPSGTGMSETGMPSPPAHFTTPLLQQQYMQPATPSSPYSQSFSPPMTPVNMPGNMYVQNGTLEPLRCTGAPSAGAGPGSEWGGSGSSDVAGSFTDIGTSCSPKLETMKNAQRLSLMDEQRRQSRMVIHTDSGVRMSSIGEVNRTVDDVPPTYTAE